MKNLNQIMKQAQQMQKKLQEAQGKLNEMEIAGTSGGGMVTVVINGKGEMKKLTLSPELMRPEEAEIVADLVIAAFSDAKSKLEAKISSEMGGVLPPGMQLPF